MNYRHAYHAGIFADVFKHIIVVTAIQSFLHKDSAFCYIDTHAGIGAYDLLSESAQKTKEYETGISKIISQPHPPAQLEPYLRSVHAMNPGSELRFYPGSSAFVRDLLRPQDRMIVSELHPEEYQSLKKFFAHDKRVAVHHQDAYQSLKAFLPPKERRGMVLIDPPYEKQDEFEQLLKNLPQAVKRWEHGVFALWYPIKNRLAETRFLTSLKEKITRPFLIAELSIYPENTPQHLNGSGMLIINPPWKLDQELQVILPWLWGVLSIHKQGSYSIKPSF